MQCVKKKKLSFPAAPAPALSLGSTAERTLLTEAGVSSPENMNLGDPDLSLVCYRVACKGGKRRRPSIPLCLRQVGELAIRVEELPLPLISCSTWGSRPYTFPLQHSRADSAG